jgi:hypothetical protein
LILPLKCPTQLLPSGKYSFAAITSIATEHLTPSPEIEILSLYVCVGVPEIVNIFVTPTTVPVSQTNPATGKEEIVTRDKLTPFLPYIVIEPESSTPT